MMISSSLRVSLAVLLAYAVAVYAAPAAPHSLTVRNSTSDVDVDVDGLGKLRVTATTVNTGGETLKLLNNPPGVLNLFHESTFTVIDPDGSHPSFGGAEIKNDSTDAAGLDNPSPFTILTPGDSIVVTRDLSAIYGLTRSSTGDYYSIEPSNKFTHVDADGTPKDLYATVEGIAKVKLPGDLATSRRIHNKRDNSYIDCSPVQQEEIVMAGGSAQMIVEEAYTYMSHVTFGSERYEKWFGPYEDHNRDIILETFQNIWQNTDFLSYTYDCSTCEKTKNHIVGDVQTVAYVTPGTVNLCPRFWELGPDGVGSKTHALIHESTHFQENAVHETVAKDDYYGAARCERAAIRRTKKAIRNADNLTHFAINRPRLP